MTRPRFQPRTFRVRVKTVNVRSVYFGFSHISSEKGTIKWRRRKGGVNSTLVCRHVFIVCNLAVHSDENKGTLGPCDMRQSLEDSYYQHHQWNSHIPKFTLTVVTASGLLKTSPNPLSSSRTCTRTWDEEGISRLQSVQCLHTWSASGFELKDCSKKN
jgi:hypothetical protein